MHNSCSAEASEEKPPNELYFVINEVNIYDLNYHYFSFFKTISRYVQHGFHCWLYKPNEALVVVGSFSHLSNFAINVFGYFLANSPI